MFANNKNTNDAHHQLFICKLFVTPKNMNIDIKSIEVLHESPELNFPT